MQLRVKARTILQLGAELISSDSIAFYELIKNAFDAESPRVTISVRRLAPHSEVTRLRAACENASDDDVQRLRSEFAAAIDGGAEGGVAFREGVLAARSLAKLRELLDQVNTIEISDRGHGISAGHLREVYLEVGTPFRLLQRGDGRKTAPLGEKGLGRLSAMRLGWRLTVRTSRKDDSSWHILDIDWREFDRDPNAYVEDIDIPKPRSEPKDSSDVHGTTIRIGGLLHDWSADQLRAIARDEFSRLTDPFSKGSRYPITLKFNGETLPVPSFDETIFSLAHAVVDARFCVQPALRFSGHIDYRLHNRVLDFELTETELASVTKTMPAILRRLGPFQVRFYWFNRQLLTAVDSIGDKKTVQKVVRDWANGLMVFRDGFRVNPYGSPANDWLDLDERAFASAGYKVNRHQIIGKVDISALANALLVDQTNREGLRSCDEFDALVLLLQHLMWQQFKVFLQSVEKDLVPNITLDELAPRVKQHRVEIRSAVRRLQVKYPAVKKEKQLLQSIDDALKQIAGVMKQAQQLGHAYEDRRSELVHLAGLGLMVEILAHELNRATQHAMGILDELSESELPASAEPTLATLRSQLKTLNTRLRVLDPLATSGRQRKEPFDIVRAISEIVESRDAQFRRHGVKCEIRSPGGGAPRPWQVRMVPGMLIQIVENLLTNSVYWLKQARRANPKHKGEITIVVDSRSRTVSVTDNGPGVLPSLAARIFEPFFTTKPPGQGKGLGLYVSREIAQYHQGTLDLSTQHTVHKDRLNTFVLALPES